MVRLVVEMLWYRDPLTVNDFRFFQITFGSASFIFLMITLVNMWAGGL